MPDLPPALDPRRHRRRRISQHRRRSELDASSRRLPGRPRSALNRDARERTISPTQNFNGRKDIMMRRRILVVDDMELNRDHLKKVLEGYEVETAVRRPLGTRAAPRPRRSTW